ncbi:MAG: hypothetical protein M3391_10870 [Actinomycetota bacterium]|nr:hypothetical protein [Actinomycetota bacterium]
MRIDPDPKLLGILTGVHRNAERLRGALRFLDRVKNPTLPGSVRSDQDQLSVVQPDAHDDGFGAVAVHPNVVARAFGARTPGWFGCVLEGPGAFHSKPHSR